MASRGDSPPSSQWEYESVDGSETYDPSCAGSISSWRDDFDDEEYDYASVTLSHRTNASEVPWGTESLSSWRDDVTVCEDVESISTVTSARNSRPPQTEPDERPGRKMASAQSHDAKDDEKDESDRGPVELGTFLAQRKARSNQRPTELASVSSEKETGHNQKRKPPEVMVQLLMHNNVLRKHVNVHIKDDSSGNPRLKMSKASPEIKKIQPASRSLPQDQLSFLKSKEGRRQAGSALSSKTAAWVVHGDKLHAYDYRNPAEGTQRCLDELQSFVAGRVPSPEPSPSMSRQLQRPILESPPPNVTIKLRLEDLNRTADVEEAFRFWRRNKHDIESRLCEHCYDPTVTLNITMDGNHHVIRIEAKRQATAEEAEEAVKIYAGSIKKSTTQLRDKNVDKAWRMGRGDDVIRSVESRLDSCVVAVKLSSEDDDDSANDDSASDDDRDQFDETPASPRTSDEVPQASSAAGAQAMEPPEDGSILQVLPSVTVHHGDMLELSVDAIVHGTDNKLSFDTNLGRAMLQKVGGGLRHACAGRQGSFHAGTAFYTSVSASSGSKFKGVIHASLPSTTNGRCDGALRDVVVAILKEAADNNIRTLALPALGINSRGFSAVDSVVSVIQGLVAFCLDNPAHGLLHVTLCDVSKTTCEMFDTILKELYALDIELLLSCMTEEATLVLADSSLQPTRMRGAGPHLRLALGSIQNLQADVLVSSATAEGAGNSVAAIVARAGGAALQNEAKRKLRDASPGDVVVTTSGDLSCRHVYHVVMSQFKGKADIEALRKGLLQCLEKAEQSRLSTIAFPPLGVGGLNFPPSVFIDALLGCVAAFKAKHTRPHLHTVVIVAYPADKGMVQTFRKAVQDYFATGNAPALPRVAHYCVGKVAVELMTGDITQSDSDAIVNCCFSLSCLNTGAISSSVLKAAGPGLQSECATLVTQMDAEKMVISGAHSLKCKNIIHVATRSDSDHWKETLPKVFQLCDKQGLTSLAIPPVGTGGMGIDAEVMAGMLFEALKEAGKSGLSCLRAVQLVIIDPSKTDAFICVFLAKTGGNSSFWPPKVIPMNAETVQVGSLSVTAALGDVRQETSHATLTFHGGLSALPRHFGSRSMQKRLPSSPAEWTREVKESLQICRNTGKASLSIAAPSIDNGEDAVRTAEAMLAGLQVAGSCQGNPLRVRLVVDNPAALGVYVQVLRQVQLTSRSHGDLPSLSSGLSRLSPTGEGGVSRSSRADVIKTSQVRMAYVTVTGMDLQKDQQVAITTLQEESRKIVALHS